MIDACRASRDLTAENAEEIGREHGSTNTVCYKFLLVSRRLGAFSRVLSAVLCVLCG